MTLQLTGPFPPNTLQQLQHALDWWVARDAIYTDLPWLVEQEYADATRPPGRRDVAALHGLFVSSGEQSFLKLWSEGRLPATGPTPSAERVYIGWTPCMRDEEHLDELHQHGFMKAEWFVPADHLDWAGQMARLMQLVWRQRLCFHAIAGRLLGAPGGGAPVPTLEPQGVGVIDLMLGGIEVGSYGIRTFRGRAYIYGTALALPRFHQALGKAVAAFEADARMNLAAPFQASSSD